ncbi:16S rRNA methyltransferase [Synechococcus sp. 60AY4M2]|nr:16S rRNA methyltransferase [Synechococcus sp. 60AY4M2]PIL00282.1 16S rRNA methyltransferase [Synechococcus sp. 65AY640]
MSGSNLIFFGAAMNARQLALLALQKIERHNAYADVVLEHLLAHSRLIPADCHLVSELVYGITRRRRTLDALIDCFARRPAHQQPLDLRLILYLGFYQLAFLDHIPPRAAIHTSVELARQVGLGSLTGVVNGILRAYQRQALDGAEKDPLKSLQDTLPTDPIQALGIRHSFPDWLVRLWWERLGPAETEQLCAWFNQPPHLDLRVNPLRADVDKVIQALAEAGIPASPIPEVPGALRLGQHAGDITALPGFAQGWWSVQDASAQQVVHYLDPQPGERVIDCCAAPGGKTTHMAEQMQDRGEIWALDRHPHRLRRLEENVQRLGLSSIRPLAIDLLSLDAAAEPPAPLPPWQSADRVLLDAPCSGLGTLHRHADARWRQTPAQIQELAHLQAQLLQVAARWLKPGGLLVYATCTLHPAENEAVIQSFLNRHPHWAAEGDPLLIWPHRQDRDGFFIQRLRRRD